MPKTVPLTSFYFVSLSLSFTLNKIFATTVASTAKKQDEVSFLTLKVHACDAWCTKSFDIRLPGGTDPPRPSSKDQPGGPSIPKEYTFQWLTLIAGKRYHQLFKPNGRVRNREAGK
tara:strand:- start:742 stop:1089 length:348 start_codon:yes stop_codon:yes gene_type:complete